MHFYKVTLRVRDDVGVLARITTRLRKFQVSIRTIDVAPLDPEEKFFDIHITVSTEKPDLTVVMKKIESLIPVIKAYWEEKKIGKDLPTI